MPANVIDKKLAAVCGLFCGTCVLYIGTNEEPTRLKELAANLGRNEKELVCHGCRADKRSYYCVSCKMGDCAAQKGVEFCGDCPEYPCDNLKAFQAEKPHRAELWQSLERIREIGWKKWQKEMYDRHACQECSTINSAYDLTCRRCGADPSCDFVKTHRESIYRHLTRT